MKVNIENAARVNQKNILKWLAETLSVNLKEMRDRLMKGDEAAVEEFFTVHTFDDGIPFTRPQQKDIEKSKFMRDLAHELKTQDNACTAEPVYLVMEKDWIYGVDEDYFYETEKVFIDDAGEITTSKELGYEEYLRMEETGQICAVYRAPEKRYVQFFLSRKAADEYIATQSHRHRGDLYVYVDSVCRNPEIKTLRETVMKLGSKSATTWHRFSDNPLTCGTTFVAAGVNPMKGQVFTYHDNGVLCDGLRNIVVPRSGHPEEVMDFLESCGFEFWMLLPDVEVV